MIYRIKSLLSKDSLKARAVRSAVATIWLAGGGQMLRFASNLLLTRLLFPEAFGLMALVQVVLGGMVMISDVGLRDSVIQNPRGNDPVFLNTAWTVQIIRGFVLWALAFAFSGLIADFFDQPELASILPVAAISLIIVGFHTTKVHSVSRDLQLGRHASLTLVSQAIGVIVITILAYALQSVWALVIGLIVQPMIALVLFERYLEGERNQLRLERDSLRDIFNLGKFLTISSIATFLMNQADRAVLGANIPIDLLGIYGLAFALAMMPMLVADQLGGKVVFPLFAKRHPLDSPSNQRNLFKVRRSLVAAGVALLSVVSLCGPWLVEVLYDDRYILAGQISVLLGLALIPRMMRVGAMQTAVAKGNSLPMMMVNVATAICHVGLLLLLVPPYGVIGAAVAIGTAPILSYPISIFYLRRYNTWDSLGDLAFFTYGLLIAALALWVHWDGVVSLATAGQS